MMDPGGDGILEVIDVHRDGGHRFHIVSKSEEASFVFSSKENRGHYIWVQVFYNTPEPFTLMRSILTRHATSRKKFRNRFLEKFLPSKFSFPNKIQKLDMHEKLKNALTEKT